VSSESASEAVLTGERTVPGVAVENYWYRRHEVAYRAVAPLCSGASVLEAGCGEGYGADLLARSARAVLAVDYDEPTTRHVAWRYPAVATARADLMALPARSGAFDVVVSMQVIEHLPDQPGFLAECLRVLRPGGTLVVSTPNRITFSPGHDVPLNPYHTRELAAGELAELLAEAGFEVREMRGVHHGARLQALDAAHGGSIIDAQLTALMGSLPGEGSLPERLAADVAAVRAGDFTIHGADVDASLDLLTTAVRP
jgi:SAM-dependent methyltransferase